jgi:hypothetical protein
MHEFAGVPRIAGMCGSSYVPSHLGMQVQPQAMGVGGGANAMMMMMM